jgi:hypothetical protein
MTSLGQHLVYLGSDHNIPSDDIYNMVVRQTLYHLVEALHSCGALNVIESEGAIAVHVDEDFKLRLRYPTGAWSDDALQMFHPNAGPKSCHTAAYRT